MSDAPGTQAIASIERLLAEAEALDDPRGRALARALAAALVELAGAGLARTLELAHEVAPGEGVAAELARALADDPLVGNLLVLAGMHPDPPAARAAAALAAIGVELAACGVDVAAVDGDVRIALARAPGRSADPERVRTLVEAAVVARAPDAAAVRVELDGRPLHAAGFVPVDRLRVLG